jgi:hypothetical protein
MNRVVTVLASAAQSWQLLHGGRAGVGVLAGVCIADSSAAGCDCESVQPGKLQRTTATSRTRNSRHSHWCSCSMLPSSIPHQGGARLLALV